MRPSTLEPLGISEPSRRGTLCMIRAVTASPGLLFTEDRVEFNRTARTVPCGIEVKGGFVFEAYPKDDRGVFGERCGQALEDWAASARQARASKGSRQANCSMPDERTF